MIGSGVIWVDARHNLLSDFPSLDAYAKRMLARPSFERGVCCYPRKNSSIRCGRFTITRRDGNSLAAELGVWPEGSISSSTIGRATTSRRRSRTSSSGSNTKIAKCFRPPGDSSAAGRKMPSMAANAINARSETIQKCGRHFATRSRSGDASCRPMDSSNGPGQRPRGSRPGSIARTASCCCSPDFTRRGRKSRACGRRRSPFSRAAANAVL